jgi:hypothetical protein
MMMDSNDANAITIIKDSTLPVSLSSSPSTIKITINKDERLEHLDIPKGLIELLQINGLTVEKILESRPSQIAKIIGTDDYVAKIIFSETIKNTSDIISNYNI